jgi:hypothetical protein
MSYKITSRLSEYLANRQGNRGAILRTPGPNQSSLTRSEPLRKEGCKLIVGTGERHVPTIFEQRREGLRWRSSAAHDERHQEQHDEDKEKKSRNLHSRPSEYAETERGRDQRDHQE